MKNIILLFTYIVFSSVAFAQTTNTDRRTIKVTGTAEIEVVPDEIFLTLTLREYINKEKKKVTIEELEKGLVNFLTNVVMTEKNNIKYDDLSAYYGYIRKKNKDEIISKTYNVKLKTSKQVYQIYSVMDSLGIKNARITKYSHSKIDEFKKQVKIDAIKSAQTKATYLLEAIGSKIGKPVSVDEKNNKVIVEDGINDGKYGYNSSMSNSLYQSSYNNDKYESDSVVGESDLSKTIKIKYEIFAEFEIQ